jgi:hypothetical protein
MQLDLADRILHVPLLSQHLRARIWIPLR